VVEEAAKAAMMQLVASSSELPSAGSSSSHCPSEEMKLVVLDDCCPVCGDRVSGYHYGLQTCESCKGPPPQRHVYTHTNLTIIKDTFFD